MEKIYTNNTAKQKVVKAKPETISFLLNYSKSLDMIKAGGIHFETHKN